MGYVQRQTSPLKTLRVGSCFMLTSFFNLKCIYFLVFCHRKYLRKWKVGYIERKHGSLWCSLRLVEHLSKTWTTRILFTSFMLKGWVKRQHVITIKGFLNRFGAHIQTNELGTRKWSCNITVQSDANVKAPNFWVLGSFQHDEKEVILKVKCCRFSFIIPWLRTVKHLTCKWLKPKSNVWYSCYRCDEGEMKKCRITSD